MSTVIGSEQIGGLTVTRLDDGTFALEFGAGAPHFIVLNAVQWAALCRLCRRARMVF